MNKVFEGTTIRGTPGLYPLTAENLFRIGLAISLLIQVDREEAPILSIDSPDFVTLSIAVGFMNGGGTVRVGGSGGVGVVCERGAEWVVHLEGISEEDIRKLEIILFGRTPMPRKTGSDIGRLEPWTQSGKP